MKCLTEKTNEQVQASPPARGAWIEMLLYRRFVRHGGRPPHGGRGLKWIWRHLRSGLKKSPPARGAWIEIITIIVMISIKKSPPARGAWIEITIARICSRVVICRPPHGGRGLKCIAASILPAHTRRPPHGGRGLKYHYEMDGMEPTAVAPRTGGVD